jgi:flagellar hook-associated protein 1
MAISNLLLTARDSLFAHRLAIDVTGGNVANVNTPGYTRQRVDMRSEGSANARGGNTQIGVAIDRVERIYNSYIESQVIEQTQNSSYSDTMLLGFQNIERVLDDTNGSGINDRLNKFWSSWENLSNNPAGKAERNDLLSAAKNLVETINSYKRNLDTINTDMNRSITDTVSQINHKIVEIRGLNEKLFGTGNSEIDTKSDLLDKRSKALKDLSGLINISQLENSDGTIDVYLPNGEPLVQGKTSRTLSVETDNTSLLSNIYFTDPLKPLNGILTNGKLGAFIELQNTVIPKYIGYINDFTRELSASVNVLHTSGYDAYKNVGSDFFTITDLVNNPSGTIDINSIIIADPNRIAGSETVTGDGVIASKIATVQNELLIDNATLNSFLATMVGEIGSQVSDAKMDSDYQTIIMNQLENQRESISGVSIDEEMIQLIKYQMGYTAAGKLVVSADEMLDTLMGLIK